MHLPNRLNPYLDAPSLPVRCVHCGVALLSHGAVTKDSTWHPHSSLPRSTDSTKFWCPVLWDHCQLGIQLWPGGRPAAPGAWETGGDSPSSLDPGLPQMTWVFGEPMRARGGRPGRRGAGGRARVRTDRAPGRRCPAPPRPWWPRVRRGQRPRRCPPSAWPARLGPEPPEQEQRPYRPLFRLHLLRLLLLPPATRAVTTGSDWPGCPAKEREGGQTAGKNFPGRRRKRRWSPEAGAGSLSPSTRPPPPPPRGSAGAEGGGSRGRA